MYINVTCWMPLIHSTKVHIYARIWGKVSVSIIQRVISPRNMGERARESEYIYREWIMYVPSRGEAWMCIGACGGAQHHYKGHIIYPQPQKRPHSWESEWEREKRGCWPSGPSIFSAQCYYTTSSSSSKRVDPRVNGQGVLSLGLRANHVLSRPR